MHQGDFVLKLSEGLQHAEQTLRDYVVTPQLAVAFDNALAFIKSAVEADRARLRICISALAGESSRPRLPLSSHCHARFTARSGPQPS